MAFTMDEIANLLRLFWSCLFIALICAGGLFVFGIVLNALASKRRHSASSQPLPLSADRKRNAVSDTVKQHVIKRDRSTCVYCGRTVYGNNLHLDHVIPWSRGGSDEADNLVVACAKCNLEKGDKTPREWHGRIAD